MMKIVIDDNSGFCFGVQNAVSLAEDILDKEGQLYCLGELVHNPVELERLTRKGLKIIDQEAFKRLRNRKVLLRAHGEPPETYRIAFKNGLELIDATCPIISNLQIRIKKQYEKIGQKNGQVVIYGKKDHAEVRALIGQLEGHAVVVSDEQDIDAIDSNRPVVLISQTTMSMEGFAGIRERLVNRIKQAGNKPDNMLFVHDTICRHVSHRQPNLIQFAREHDTILFVSGKQSSNGRLLFQVCKKVNPDSFFISSVNDLNKIQIPVSESIGICGATSTPGWLLEKVAEKVRNMNEGRKR